MHPRLSVLLPTVHAWPGAKLAYESLRAQACGDPFELLLLDGHGAALEREPGPPVRWIRAPGADVFELRARGLAESRGEIVAITEDHCVMPPGWLGQILAAHGANPAAALVGPVRNHSDSSRKSVDRANFLLTLGPFAPPLQALSRWRLPVPTNVSFKRVVLPRTPPESGWLEYDLLAKLREEGELAVATDATIEHRQSWSALAAPVIHFHSGRSYGASTRRWSFPSRREWFRELPRLPRRMYWMTRPSLDRGAGGAAPNTADRLWLAVLILANSLGQLSGALLGAGNSRRRLV